MKYDKINTGKILKTNKKSIVTNPEKVYWPDEGITKGDLIEYYQKISDYILPYLTNRPQTLLRHPNGIEEDGFFQKDVSQIVPDWAETVKVVSESTGREVTYFVITDLKSLLYLVNLGCIEINPWFSRVGKLEFPDYLVLDLDPLEIAFDKVVQTALTIKEILDSAGAKSYCKTSGSTGLHIYVPLNAKYDYDMAKQFAHLIAKIAHKRLPDITSLERTPEKRRGKVYIDYLQNRIAQTLAAPYSVRPKPGAPVAAPLHWEEVKPGLDPKSFTINTIFNRLKETKDFFREILEQEVNLIKCINNLEAKISLNS